MANKTNKKKQASILKETENKKTVVPVSSDEMTKLIRIVFIIVAIVIIFYAITVLITKYKKENYERNTTPIKAIIQYDEIIIGTLLNQSRNEYYVLMEKEENLYHSLLQSYLDSYQTKQNALKVYTVNLDSIFNADYISSESKLNVENIKDFRVSNISLIKVKDQKIVETYEGIDQVENALKNLIK